MVAKEEGGWERDDGESGVDANSCRTGKQRGPAERRRELCSLSCDKP